MARLMIVDDDLNTCQSLNSALCKEGHQIFEAHSGEEALEKIGGQEVDVMVIDLMMPGMNGLEFFKTLKASRPEIVAIMVSARPSVDVAVSAIKSGIYDFITKPFRLGEIKKAIGKALEAQALLTENRRLRQALREKASFSKIIGTSPAFSEVMDLVAKVAPTRSTVLLSGESGTGKEIIAEAIHFASPRGEEPLVKMNCGALTETLMESELFGHEKGAFTGAHQQRKGRFEMANGGTLFLDEIGEMSLPMQVKLLRVIQDGAFERVGSSRTIAVDVRLIAATNRDLEKAVKDGQFRQDLFYRLNVITIEIPPLRERLEDIPLLAGYFLNKYAALNQKEISGFSDEVQEVLIHYPWPGNVRELENIVERAVSLGQGRTIELSDLPPRLKLESMEQAVSRGRIQTIELSTLRQKSSQEPLADNYLVLPMGTPLDEIEQAVVHKTLENTKGDKKTAARILGISLSSLYNKLNRGEAKIE
ncbi:MAG TPA: sigma-54 dependent transcriptional regulator [Thermodesulfobacteriota bacterium]|nr:sigma-54 dependent transcriptional regulator [Thermodesulfobacteriota bacterium]